MSMQVTQKNAVSSTEISKQPGLTDLPDELTLRILGFLNKDDLVEVRQANRVLRACVADITRSSFVKACDLILEEVNPYLGGDQQARLQELLMPFRPGAQVVAGVPLAFDAKNAWKVFRQELIRFLATSTAPVEEETNSLSRRAFIELLPREFRHIVSLTKLCRDVKLVKEHPTLSNDQKLVIYEKLVLDYVSIHRPQSVCMLDAFSLLDIEVFKFLFKKVYYDDNSLAFKFVQSLSLPDQDKLIENMVRYNKNIAVSMIQGIADPDRKNRLLHRAIGHLNSSGLAGLALELLPYLTDADNQALACTAIGAALGYNMRSLSVYTMINMLTGCSRRLSPLHFGKLYEGFSCQFSGQIKTQMVQVALENKNFSLALVVATDRELDKPIQNYLIDEVVTGFIKDLPQDAEDAYQAIERLLETIICKPACISIRDCFIAASLEQGQFELALKLLKQRSNVGYDRSRSELIQGHLKKAIDHHVAVGNVEMALEFERYINNGVSSLRDEATEAPILAGKSTVSIKRRRVGKYELRDLGIDPTALDTEEARRKIGAPRASRAQKK